MAPISEYQGMITKRDIFYSVCNIPNFAKLKKKRIGNCLIKNAFFFAIYFVLGENIHMPQLHLLLC